MTRRPDLPTGTVTFLFTDIEGSTRLIEKLGERRYVEALSHHRATLREAFTAHGGVEVDNQGDAFFYAFPEPMAAVAAAAEAQGALAAGPVSVRMGLHTGEPRLTQEGYAGREVHRAARIAASVHGGQVVLSRETRALLDERFELLDLGEHRVKDFAEPVWLYQLGTERFPPLKTISSTNLPRPASSFVGREQEVAEIGALLRDDSRLVTLTGPGGTGKTRLALEAAAELVPEFKNGVFWVPLAALRDAALVPETIAQTIGAKDGLAEHIADREMLLLLDNLERIVESAPGLASLVEACPNLRLLVTSRERLRVRGESEFAVPPLATEEAVTLFSERAGLEPDETVAELCRRLDDLPLAVELAAARTSVLSPAEILERLSKRLDLLKGGRDADPRQATLRTTIAWSHDLLSPQEQRLFARLSVFRGGWTLEAAEAIADADLDVLQSLVDKSLVRRTAGRFAMLETIRGYAGECLTDSGDIEDVRRRHAEHFVALAEEAEPHLGMGGDDPKPWLDRLDAEHDNIRAALDRLAESGAGQLEQRLTAVMWRFWQTRGLYGEARRRLEHAIEADQRPSAGRAWTLFGAGVVVANTGEDPEATRLFGEALSLFEDVGDAFGAARVRMNFGTAALQEGEFERGRQILEPIIDAFEELGEERWAIFTMRMLAWAHWELGQRERATGLREEVIRRAHAIGAAQIEAHALGGQGEDLISEGRVGDGVRMLERSMRIFIELNDPEQIATSLCRFSRALAMSGHPEVAAKILARGEALLVEIGRVVDPWLARANDEVRSLIRADLDDGGFAAATEQGRKLTVEDAVVLALGEAW